MADWDGWMHKCRYTVIRHGKSDDVLTYVCLVKPPFKRAIYYLSYNQTFNMVRREGR